MDEAKVKTTLVWLTQLATNARTVNDGEGEPLAICADAVKDLLSSLAARLRAVEAPRETVQQFMAQAFEMPYEHIPNNQPLAARAVEALLRTALAADEGGRLRAVEAQQAKAILELRAYIKDRARCSYRPHQSVVLALQYLELPAAGVVPSPPDKDKE